MVRARFGVIALLTAGITLWLLDWALFDTSAVALRLSVSEDRLPAQKLLLADRYRDARVLYLGDSRIDAGVDPTIVAETCRCDPGYNAAFSGADTRLTRIMADRVLEKLSPEIVVIGVSQWDLSDAAHIRYHRPVAELAAPWDVADFGVTLDRSEVARATLSAAWRLYRYRGEVRAALDPSIVSARPDELRAGFRVYSGPRRLREEDRDAREQQWFNGFSVHGRRAEALKAVIDDLGGRGIRVILVAPPLHDKFHADVRREAEAFGMAVQELATVRGVHFEDLTVPRQIGLSPDDFEDPVHLTEAGAVQFSRHLGRVIESRLDPGR